MSADKKPSPPPEIQGESLLEWERICDELASTELLAADRAMLVLYCQCWETYQAAMKGVVAHGAIVKHHNGVAGASPFYKVAQETRAQLQKFLAEMGLTPMARSKNKTTAEEPAEWEF